MATFGRTNGPDDGNDGNGHQVDGSGVVLPKSYNFGLTEIALMYGGAGVGIIFFMPYHS